MRPQALPTPAAALVVLLAAGPGPARADWPQWGGPGRDFQAPAVELADRWPADGPRKLWSRELGDGYSAILAVSGRLYTMYRERDGEEIVGAFDAATGETLWQHRYEAVVPGPMRLNFGKGPHSTPLVAGGRVFAAGTLARLSALDAGSGELLWSHDLWNDFGGNVLVRGYAASPIAHRDAVILPVGENGRGMMAFAQSDGRVLWQAGNFKASPSSPVLIEVDGREQLVAFVVDEIVGLDPADGRLLWSLEHPATAAYNISTPIWTPSDSTLFVSSAYGGGSRMLRLAAGDGGEATVEELWATNKLRIHFTNALRLGGHVYAVSGQTGAKVLVAADAASGEVAWKDRAVARANLLQAGERTIALEGEGRLLLLGLSPGGVTIHAETRLTEGRTWTVPTLVGRTLYVRDTERMMALELPAPPSSP